jgi:hypothetical protein
MKWLLGVTCCLAFFGCSQGKFVCYYSDEQPMTQLKLEGCRDSLFLRLQLIEVPDTARWSKFKTTFLTPRKGYFHLENNFYSMDSLSVSIDSYEIRTDRAVLFSKHFIIPAYFDDFNKSHIYCDTMGCISNLAGNRGPDSISFCEIDSTIELPFNHKMKMNRVDLIEVSLKFNVKSSKCDTLIKIKQQLHRGRCGGFALKKEGNGSRGAR